jgi:hypothetical protein
MSKRFHCFKGNPDSKQATGPKPCSVPELELTLRLVISGAHAPTQLSLSACAHCVMQDTPMGHANLNELHDADAIMDVRGSGISFFDSAFSWFSSLAPDSTF